MLLTSSIRQYVDIQHNNTLMIELERHLKFKSLLAELSANFVSISIDVIDQEILESLRQISENLDLDHIGIGEITPDGQDFFSSYQYAKPNEALPQTNESWLVLNSVGRAPLVPVW
jgi:hypothetical protein